MLNIKLILPQVTVRGKHLFTLHGHLTTHWPVKVHHFW